MTQRSSRWFSLVVTGLVCLGLSTACGGDGDGDPDGGSADAGGPICEDIEWSPKSHYLVNGNTVARWQQSAFVDANGDGKINADEWVDEDIDILELCETGKQSLVLLIGTDNCPPCLTQFAAVRKVVPEIQAAGGLFFAVYLGLDDTQGPVDIPNEEAAEILMDEDHMDGRRGNFWSGTHPAFNINHGVPFSAVIDLETGEVLATDPIPQLITVDEIMDAVHEANES